MPRLQSHNCAQLEPAYEDAMRAELLFRDNTFLMTGTGIVPGDEFTLKSGDIISITIDGIGTLTNPIA